MYIYNEKQCSSKFHIIMLDLPLALRKKKWEICDSNIFLEIINNTTQADTTVVFGLAD